MLSFTSLFTDQRLIHSLRSLIPSSLLHQRIPTTFTFSLLRILSYLWEMATIAVHQISQSITCHAWSPDQSSNSALYRAFSLFLFFPLVWMLIKCPLRGWSWLWFTERERRLFVLKFCKIWLDGIYLVI